MSCERCGSTDPPWVEIPFPALPFEWPYGKGRSNVETLRVCEPCLDFWRKATTKIAEDFAHGSPLGAARRKALGELPDEPDPDYPQHECKEWRHEEGCSPDEFGEFSGSVIRFVGTWVMVNYVRPRAMDCFESISKVSFCPWCGEKLLDPPAREQES